MPLYKTEGIVIRNREIGESDRIVTVLTKDRGKVNAVAKGARKTKSKLASGSQLLNHNLFLMYEGKGLDIISQIETKDSFIDLKKELQKLGSALYLAELFGETVEEGQKSSQVFYLLLTALHLLMDSNKPELVTRTMEMRLLSVIGYHPELERCAACGESLKSGTPIYFSLREGGIICGNCSLAHGSIEVNRGALETLKNLQNWDLRKLDRLYIPPALMEKIEALLEKFLLYYLEKKLKSKEFLRNIKKFNKQFDMNI